MTADEIRLLHLRGTLKHIGEIQHYGNWPSLGEYMRHLALMALHEDDERRLPAPISEEGTRG